MAVEDFWLSNGAGNWTTSGDPPWSDGSPPTTGQDAFIGFITNTAVVSSQVNETVNSIGTNATSVLLIEDDSTLTATNGTTLNSGDTGSTANGNLNNITVEDGSTLKIGQGTFDNVGSVELNASTDTTAFSVANSVMLTGSGTIEMSASSNNFIKGAGGSSSLTNMNNTISGGGVIGGGLNALAFTNDSDGTLETNNSLGTGTLQIVGSDIGGSFTNEGTVEANNGGTLIFGEASGTGSLDNATSVFLESSGSTTELQIAGNVTVNGGGTIWLLGTTPASDKVVSNGSAATLTLVNQTLKGAGTVGDSHLTLNNQSGTVIADNTTYALNLNTGSNTITNGGTLEATDGGSLDIESAVNNTGVIAVGSSAGDPTSIVGLEAAVTGSGAIDIGSGGDLIVEAAVAGNITFTGANAGLLFIPSDNDLSGTVMGAIATDSIDFVGVNPAGDHVVWQQTSASAGVLSLYNDGADLANLNMAGTFNSLDFTVGNGAFGTLVTVQNTPTFAENAGNNDEWILSDGNYVESAGPGPGPTDSSGNPYQFAGIGDWTGNGTDGILWFDPSTGDVNEWQLANTQWAAGPDLGTHPANSTDGNSYQIAGTGDFFDNGRDGVLWTSVNSNGTVATDIWELNSSGQWMASQSPGNHPGGYTVAGTGDWTGDGTDGILWFNASTGNVDEWQLANGQWSPSSPGSLGSHPANSTDGNSYQIAGIGDFFDNGRDGVLWTSVNADGTVATDIWELNSSGQWMQSQSPGNHPAGFSVVAVGDTTGTGTSDIIWYNSSTGDTDEWLINNGQWAGSIDLGTHPGNYQIAGVGDFTGTGTKDILWHSA